MPEWPTRDAIAASRARDGGGRLRPGRRGARRGGQRDDQRRVAVGWDEEDIWDATRCSPVADAPGQLGDPCTVEESSFSGIDGCDFGLMCFLVTPGTLTGSCVQQCQGSSSDPICATRNTTCLIANNAPRALCLPTCDPLDPDLACPQYDLGERCLALFENPPPDHSDVGFCGLPP